MVVAVRGTGFRAMDGKVCCRGAGFGRGDVVNGGDMCDVGDVGDVAVMGESGALLELPPERSTPGWRRIKTDRLR